jgi:hypothetical protein
VIDRRFLNPATHRERLLLDEAFTPEHVLITSPGRFRAHSQIDSRLHVSDADPVVWVAEELLHLLHEGVHHPDVTFRCCLRAGGSPGRVGDVIRIDAPEGTFVYVITRQVPEHPGIWEARWPD